MPILNRRKHHTKPISFEFKKPTRIDLVGSYLLHSNIKSRCNIDIAMQIPDSCFVPKDIMDYRYHDKRRLYLSVIASELSKEPTFSEVMVRGWREGNDDNKPILVFKLQPKAKNISSRAKKFSIRVYPVISKNVFELVKLNPLKGNLRMHRKNPVIAGETVEEAK